MILSANDWGSGFPPTDRAVMIRATVNGTGTVTATYNVYLGSLINGVVVYDSAAVATILLSGTTVDTGSTLFPVMPNKYWKVVLSNVSGTGVHTSCVAEY